MKNCAIILLMIFVTLSCKKLPSQENEITFTALGKLTLHDADQVRMSTDDNKTIIFHEVNSNEIPIEIGRRVYVIGKITSQTENLYDALMGGLTYVNERTPSLIDDIKDDAQWRDKLGHDNVGINHTNLSGNYLTLFTGSTKDNLSLVITNRNESNDGTITLDTELCNNMEKDGGSIITSFDISKYSGYTSVKINIKYKNMNSTTKELSLIWSK